MVRTNLVEMIAAAAEMALADGRAEIAVHSMKDVPESLAAGMILAAISEREDSRDLLVTKDSGDLF